MRRIDVTTETLQSRALKKPPFKTSKRPRKDKFAVEGVAWGPSLQKEPNVNARRSYRRPYLARWGLTWQDEARRPGRVAAASS